MMLKVAFEITTATSVLFTSVCAPCGELKNEKCKSSPIGTLLGEK